MEERAPKDRRRARDIARAEEPDFGSRVDAA